jgi:hypothetical protein
MPDPYDDNASDPPTHRAAKHPRANPIKHSPRHLHLPRLSLLSFSQKQKAHRPKATVGNSVRNQFPDAWMRDAVEAT